MNNYEVLVAWRLAGAFCLAFILIVTFWKIDSEFENRSFCDAEVTITTSKIVIGSSLSRDAFAANDDTFPQSVVFWEGGLAPDIGFSLLECALQTNASTIFIEANTFSSAKDYKTDIQYFLQKFTQKVRSIIDEFIGKDEKFDVFIGNDEKFTEVWNGIWPRKIYVSDVQTAVSDVWSYRLKNLVSLTKKKVILFEPPMTTWKSHVRNFNFVYEDEIRKLSSNSGLPLLNVWPIWDDEYFRDSNGHLNTHGSVRFQGEFWNMVDNSNYGN